MKIGRYALAGVILFLAGFTSYCGGRSLGNNSSDSGITTNAGVVTTASTDTTAPTVSSYTPANGSTPAPNITLVSVTFSEAIDTSTVTSSSFHVKSGGTCAGTQVTANAAVASNSNQTFTITLTGALSTSTQYSTCLTSDIKDVAGNALTAANVAWTTTATNDVTAPTNVTGLAVQPGLQRLILTWTNPGAADYAAVKILRKTTNDITDQNDATATVACGGEIATPQTTCTDTGLTNGTTYYYKIFARDAVPNYSSGANTSGVPACGTIEDIRSLNTSPTTTNAFALDTCTLPQVTVTSVNRDGSNMGFYIQQTQTGAGIYVFTASVNPTTTLNLTPGDRITFNGGTWAGLCVTAFNRSLQIVKKTDNTCLTNATFAASDFTEGAANASYIANLGTTISGNTTFSTDYTNGAEGRLYVFSTAVSITGAVSSGVYPASFGTSSTINVTNTALAATLLANGVQFTPGRAVMGRYQDTLELRHYGTGSGGTTNYDGITAGGGENGYAIKSVTYTTAPTISFFSPSNNGGFNTGSTQVSVGFDQMMATGSVTTTSFKVVAGTDCTGASLTNSGISNSNGQKTFTLTLNGGQLVDGNQYTTCITTGVTNTSSIALASAQSASWRGSSLTSTFANFEAWDTANQPTGWVYGTPPSGGSGGAGTASGNITQDTTSPLQGARSANVNTAATSGNGNVLSYATTGSALGGSCTRIAVWMRGTSSANSFAIQLQSAGGTNANYCNVNNDVLATSIASASVIEPASAGYTGTVINTGGNWRVAVCRIDNLNGGSMNTFRIRWGNPSAYNISFDTIEFLDSANNPCVPVDFTAPTVSAASPTSGATGVALAVSASVTFDKGMNTTAVNGAYTVKETDCSGTTVSTGTPTASGSNTIFTYSLTGLKPSTVYSHCVTTGATSSAGTALAAQYSSTFTTGALNDPTSLTYTGAATQVTIGWTNSSNADSGVKIVFDTAGTPANCNSGTTACTGATCNATLTAGSAGRTFVHTGLTNGTQYFYRVCANHTGSYLSSGATGSATPAVDATAPSAVSTLATGTVAATSVVLNWTSVGDDAGTGTATSYSIRYGTGGSCPFTDGNFGSTGTLVGSPPTPQVAGSAETKTVTGLTASTQYWFALKVNDEIPNTSTISNCVTATTSASGGNATDLFISEYLEGNSNNKCIEIFNGTGATVDASTYRLVLYGNGSATVTGTTALTALTSFANNATYTVCNTGLSGGTSITANLSHSGAPNYNGDDHVALQKDTGGGTWVNVDVFGSNIGTDPGTCWLNDGSAASAGCTAGNSTVDTIWRRNATIASPTTTWTASEWSKTNGGSDVNIAANHNFGSHTFTP